MAFPDVERLYVDTRFGQSHVFRAGPSGPVNRNPLICFHMSPWSAMYFEPFLAEMGKDRQVFAVDTPGYGNSDPPPEQPDMADYANAMCDVIDGLRLDTYNLLGDRTGAKIALEVSRKRPNQVAQMVLISPVIWNDQELVQRKNFPKETVNADGSHVSALWRLSVALSMPERSLERLANIFHTRLLKQDTAHWSRRAAAYYDAAAVLRETDKPILVLNPKDDLWGFASRATEYLQHKESYVRDLPDWGFGFVEVKSAPFAEIVREFVDA